MYFVITALAAVVTTAIWYIKEGKYKLGFLSLLLWGATIMWLVDHVIGYMLEGGEFLEVTPDAALLGGVVVIIAFIIWEIALLSADPKGFLRRLSSR